MKFLMIEKYDDGSKDERFYPQAKIKGKLLNSINVGCVKTIEIYANKGKKILDRVLYFERKGDITPWKLQKRR